MNHPRKTSLAVLSALSCLIALSAIPSAQADQFKLHAVQQDRLKDPSTQLNRSDIKPTHKADPFDQDADDELDAPQATFQAEKPMQAPKQRPFALNAASTGAAMVPPNMEGDPDAVAKKPAPPPFDPNDPDSSPDMQLAWDAWHKRVAATIFDRFNFFAKAAFKHSPPLMSCLSYQVTRDGHIVNMQMSQKASNVLFNVLVYQSVKSLDGDMNVLAFPQGSRRSVVAKMGTFTQNYGQEGFRYQTGDQERIRAQQAAAPMR